MPVPPLVLTHKLYHLFYILNINLDMDKPSSPLNNKSLLIIFAYAPAGLGHLRVTDALYHGLLKDVETPLLLGSQDTTITYLHRLMSLNPIIRPISEWVEKGMAEDATTALYRYLLRSKTDVLYNQLLTIISERYTPPSKILAVATHFGLAHQMSAIKKQLEKEKNIEMKLVVQVTDDSPHHIWYVHDADLIVVPSEKTKENLVKYGRQMKSEVPIVVNAYPISPNLNKNLSQEKITEKYDQVDPKKQTPLHVIIPVSGAAVGTEYFVKLMTHLHQKSDRFVFHVVTKDAPFTRNFIMKITDLPYVHLYTGAADRKVIENYEFVYKQNVIALEITKPSEQSFKALMDCRKESASILLFTEPVGRQEWDNLDFLRRHHLIPTRVEQSVLWRHNAREKAVKKAFKWRGICLPDDPIAAAEFIHWSLKSGIFASMMRCEIKPHSEDEYKHELNPEGVKSFWEIVSGLFT